MARMPDEPDKPRGTSIAEQREAMARRGDVAGLVGIWTNPYASINFGEIANLVRRAVEQRAGSDPTRLADDLFTEMLSLAGYLLLRGTVYARRLIAQEDSNAQCRSNWHMSGDLEALLPKLFELQKHVAELGQLRASTIRLHELGRRTKIENDRIERTARLREQQKSSRKRRAAPPTANGFHPANRLAGLVGQP